MRSRWLAIAVLASSAPARAGDPAPPRPAYEGGVGVGYYERVHLGFAYRPGPATSIGAFAGSDFGLGDDLTWAVGLSYARALRRFAGRFEVGLDGKALYWGRSSDDYAWDMVTLVAGPYVAREIAPGITLALDGGVALSFSIDADRKQNLTYEYPTRWNGSVALALRYGFDRW